MPWAEVSPGHFERDFDSLEKFYFLIKGSTLPIGREHFQISVTFTVTPFPSESELHSAWKCVRNQHPQIAAYKQGDRYIYKTPTASQLEHWVAETCVYHQHDDDGKGEPKSSDTSAFGLEDEQHIGDQKSHPGAQARLVADRPVSAEPIDNMELHAFVETGELQIRTSHWRIDGIGCLHLTDALMRALAHPAGEQSLVWHGTEASRLVPGIDEALSVPVKDQPERLAAAAKILRFLGDNPSTMALPLLPSKMPAEVACIHRSYGTQATKKLIASCKARGISVTTAVHAALILAGRRCDLKARARAGESKERRQQQDAAAPYVYTDLTSFSLRKYLPAPYSGPSAAVSVYHTGLPISVSMPWVGEAVSDESPATASQLFSHVTSQIGETYKKDLGADPAHLFDYLSHWVRALGEATFATPTDGRPPPPPPPPPPAAVPDLSSLGVLENHLKHEYTDGHKSLTLNDWKIRVQIIDQHVMCNCWTWRGQLHIQGIWNTANYSEQFISELMDEWQAILTQQTMI